VYTGVTTKSFAKAFTRLPVNWQKRIVGKIKEVAADPYAKHNNVTRLQGGFDLFHRLNQRGPSLG